MVGTNGIISYPIAIDVYLACVMIELCNDEKYLCNLGLSNYQQIIKYIHAYVYINIVDNKSNLKLEDF